MHAHGMDGRSVTHEPLNKQEQWSESREPKCHMTFKKETHPRRFGGLMKVKKSFFQPETCVGSGRMGKSPSVGRQGGMTKGSK